MIYAYLLSVYNILKENSLVDSLTLLVGFRKKWASRNVVEDYAVGFLMEHNAPEAIELAMIDELYDYEVEKQLLSWAGVKCFDENKNELVEKRRWLYAFLKVIYEIGYVTADDVESNLGLKLVFEVFAEFDYPEEMERCSMYYSSSEGNVGKERIDPWKEVGKLILKLEKELKIGTVG